MILFTLAWLCSLSAGGESKVHLYRRKCTCLNNKEVHLLMPRVPDTRAKMRVGNDASITALISESDILIVLYGSLKELKQSCLSSSSSSCSKYLT